jgi:hypothetical protein
MPYEHSNQRPPKPPLGAGCARAMRLARTTSRFGDLPDLYILNAELVVCHMSRQRASRQCERDFWLIKSASSEINENGHSVIPITPHSRFLPMLPAVGYWLLRWRTF